MKTRISADQENRDFLAKAFKITPRMVRKALSFESDTELAQKIRHLALKRGAVETATLPICETIHDANGYMRQYFPNGAELEADKNTGRVRILFDGKVRHSYSQVSISELLVIQDIAKELTIKS